MLELLAGERRPRRARALHADPLRRTSSSGVGAPVINIHHSFLPAFVGADPYRRAQRARREDHRRDRALRHRGARRGPDHRAGRRARVAPRGRRRSSRASAATSSASCSPARWTGTSRTACSSTRTGPSSSTSGAVATGRAQARIIPLKSPLPARVRRSALRRRRSGLVSGGGRRGADTRGPRVAALGSLIDRGDDRPVDDHVVAVALARELRQQILGEPLAAGRDRRRGGDPIQPLVERLGLGHDCGRRTKCVGPPARPVRAARPAADPHRGRSRRARSRPAATRAGSRAPRAPASSRRGSPRPGRCGA